MLKQGRDWIAAEGFAAKLLPGQQLIYSPRVGQCQGPQDEGPFLTLLHCGVLVEATEGNVIKNPDDSRLDQDTFPKEHLYQIV